MTQCNLTQTEQMRRKEIADHTRALVIDLLHVDAEDETSRCGVGQLVRPDLSPALPAGEHFNYRL